MSPSQIGATFPARPWKWRIEIKALWADIDQFAFDHDEVRAAAREIHAALSGRPSVAPGLARDVLLDELDGVANAPDDAFDDDYTRCDDLADRITAMYDWADKHRVWIEAVPVPVREG